MPAGVKVQAKFLRQEGFPLAVAIGLPFVYALQAAVPSPDRVPGSLLVMPRHTLRNMRARFEEIKRFSFLPNSGFAFVVNNRLGKRSWHGREQLAPDCGVRYSLAMTFYAPGDKACEGYGPSV